MEVRPILFDLGVVELKDRPQVGDDVDPVRASELLRDQPYMSVMVRGEKFQLSRSKSKSEISINGLGGCEEIYFYSESIGCRLKADYAHRPNMLHLSYELETLVGPREREVLDEKMILCERAPDVEVDPSESAIFDDVYFIKLELASLKGEGLSPKTGLYLQEDRIQERERVLNSFIRFWSAQTKSKYEKFEQLKLRADLTLSHFETSYLGCPISFSFSEHNTCHVESNTALEVDRARFECHTIALQGGKLWCDGAPFEFSSKCPLGAVAGRSVAGAIPSGQGSTHVYDGARAPSKESATENPPFSGSREPGKVISK